MADTSLAPLAVMAATAIQTAFKFTGQKRMLVGGNSQRELHIVACKQTQRVAPPFHVRKYD
jgi:hypothetical protein